MFTAAIGAFSDVLKGRNLNRYCTISTNSSAAAKRGAVLAMLIGSLLAPAAAAAKIDRIYQANFTAVGRSVPFKCVDTKSRAELACPDVIMLRDEQFKTITEPYRRGDFDALETAFERWRGGGKQLGDGTWELALYIPGLAHAFTTVSVDTAKLAAWKTKKPDSVAALYAEANLWYVHALRVKSNDPHAEPSKEAKQISAERLVRAAALLRKLEPRMSDSPAWYETRIAVLLEQGSVTEARKAFNEAVKRFPRYHPLYFTMGRAYTGRAFEAFANGAVESTMQFEGRGLYARLYRQVDNMNGTPFDPERSSIPRWTELRAGYEDLLQRYPSSIGLATSFASVLCRTDESEPYRRMRRRADAYLIVESFSVVPVEACDRRHGWSAVE